MRRSKIADEIARDMENERYFRNKVKRNICILDNEKQCNKCKYQDICENKEQKE